MSIETSVDDSSPALEFCRLINELDCGLKLGILRPIGQAPHIIIAEILSFYGSCPAVPYGLQGTEESIGTLDPNCFVHLVDLARPLECDL